MDRVLCQGFAFDIPGFYDDGLLKVRPDEGRRPSGMEGASHHRGWRGRLSKSLLVCIF